MELQREHIPHVPVHVLQGGQAELQVGVTPGPSSAAEGDGEKLGAGDGRSIAAQAGERMAAQQVGSNPGAAEPEAGLRSGTDWAAAPDRVACHQHYLACCGR